MLLSLENIDCYQTLFGMNDRNMAVLEQELSVTTALRGQELKITGDPENVALAHPLQNTGPARVCGRRTPS